ncbi:hypothetical protein ACFYP6_13935 [Streptomyces goshikiensis]|uniref:hypothetical protein n=1 Tax=Streptomyces goshikiensis TaxID=1942 RepID=UPI0036C9DB74
MSGHWNLGVLTLKEIDQPWMVCDFSPGEDWANAKEIFEDLRAAREALDWERELEPLKKMLDLKLYIVPDDDSGPVRVQAINISETRTAFRF